jgi:N6-L-threonylcarbamoyladenine synthase
MSGGYILRCFLGIDTSCYTTSVAVVDENEKLLADARSLLDVPSGERGLSQSEGVFQHVRKIPILVERIFQTVPPDVALAGVAVSAMPRPVKESYMPVFKVGEAIGASIAAAVRVPLYQTSHQLNHVLAGQWSAGGPQFDKFLALHLSGGTTELHHVTVHNGELTFTLLGESMDLHAGQFVDRVGVKLGLPFPAGPHLEKLASLASHAELTLPSSVHNMQISFSGPESQAQRLIQAGHQSEDIAAAVFHCIANSLEKLLRKAIEATGIKDVLLVGGVASNGIIREQLRHRLLHRAVGAQLFFALPEYSRDNAIGTALWACRQYKAGFK